MITVTSPVAISGVDRYQSAPGRGSRQVHHRPLHWGRTPVPPHRPTSSLPAWIATAGALTALPQLQMPKLRKLHRLGRATAHLCGHPGLQHRSDLVNYRKYTINDVLTPGRSQCIETGRKCTGTWKYGQDNTFIPVLDGDAHVDPHRPPPPQVLLALSSFANPHLMRHIHTQCG